MQRGSLVPEFRLIQSRAEQQVQWHSRKGNARADTTNALGKHNKQQGWVWTLSPRIKSGGKVARGKDADNKLKYYVPFVCCCRP